MTRSRWIALSSLAAAALAFTVAPSLFARGGGTGGGGKSGSGGGSVDGGADDGSEPPPDENPDSSSGKGTSGQSKPGKTIDGKVVPRDGEEQNAIARDVLDAVARAEFLRLREELTRRSVDALPR